ncbi:MAG: PPC domain-containing protein [Bacteroidota bacterium]
MRVLLLVSCFALIGSLAEAQEVHTASSPRDQAVDTETVSGTLTASTPRRPLRVNGDARPADVYSIDLERGDRLTLDMRGSFDTYLRLENEEGLIDTGDDYRGNAGHSHIEYTALASGTYTVLAGAYSSFGSGDYTLEMSVQGGDARPDAEASAPAEEVPLVEALNRLIRAAPTFASVRGEENPFTVGGDGWDLALQVEDAVDGFISCLSAGCSARITLVEDAERQPGFAYELARTTIGRAASDAYGGDLEGGPYRVNRSINGSTHRNLWTPQSGGPTIELVMTEGGIFSSGYTIAVVVRATASDSPPETPAPTPEPSSPVITANQTVTGRLSASTPERPLLRAEGTERRADLVRIRLGRGDRLTVNMRGDFDTYLRLEQNGTLLSTNDDFGGNLRHSHIEHTASVSGTYTLLAGTYSPIGAGDYTLEVDIQQDGESAPNASVITASRAVTGRLSSSTPERPLFRDGRERRANAYSVRLDAGQRLTLDLRSPDFDTYLRLERDGRILEINDDYGGQSRHSHIEHTASADETYTVLAGSFFTNSTGDYTLDIEIAGGTRPATDEPAPDGRVSLEDAINQLILAGPDFSAVRGWSIGGGYYAVELDIRNTQGAARTGCGPTMCLAEIDLRRGLSASTAEQVYRETVQALRTFDLEGGPYRIEETSRDSRVSTVWSPRNAPGPNILVTKTRGSTTYALVIRVAYPRDN